MRADAETHWKFEDSQTIRFRQDGDHGVGHLVSATFHPLQKPSRQRHTTGRRKDRVSSRTEKASQLYPAVDSRGQPRGGRLEV
jgi:hypothetical protein